MGIRDVAQIFIEGKDATKGAFDSAKANVRDLGSEVDKLKGLFAGLGAAVAGSALVLMVKHSLDAIAALDDLSKATGASVESLSVMREVAKLSSTAFEGQIIPSIQKLSK